MCVYKDNVRKLSLVYKDISSQPKDLLKWLWHWIYLSYQDLMPNDVKSLKNYIKK